MTRDARVTRGMSAQLEAWRARLAAGAARVGWKIGINEPRMQKHLGLTRPVVGHLTLATVLVPGAAHSLAGGTMVGAEPEVAIHLAADVPPAATRAQAAAAITGLGPAIELIDVNGPFDDLARILAGNVFHRAVLFGATRPGATLAGVGATVQRNGETVATAPADTVGDPAETVRLVADELGACGERLLAGDWILSGSITAPVWVAAGDRIAVDLGALGELTLDLTA